MNNDNFLELEKDFIKERIHVGSGSFGTYREDGIVAGTGDWVKQIDCLSK